MKKITRRLSKLVRRKASPQNTDTEESIQTSSVAPKLTLNLPESSDSTPFVDNTTPPRHPNSRRGEIPGQFYTLSRNSSRSGTIASNATGYHIEPMSDATNNGLFIRNADSSMFEELADSRRQIQALQAQLTEVKAAHTRLVVGGAGFPREEEDTDTKLKMRVKMLEKLVKELGGTVPVEENGIIEHESIEKQEVNAEAKDKIHVGKVEDSEKEFVASG